MPLVAEMIRSEITLTGRGRDDSCLLPPTQIHTCETTAYGSSLGDVTRSDPQDKDVHF
jgi:putative transposase